MDRRLSPLALAIASSLMLTTHVWAAGGANGNNGSILINPADFSSGAPGPGLTASGENGANLTNTSAITIDQSNNAPTQGGNGQDAVLNGTEVRSAGGIGGAGGGSVFGGISQGGAGSAAFNAIAVGGAGGDIANKAINRTGSNTITLYGANAGDGGAAGTASPVAGGAGGSGGAGGGSIFGGLSQGGGGGAGNSSLSTEGGAGGSISNITIDLTKFELSGKAGGAGGEGAVTTSSGAVGAGGAGGAGGGSIFGGLSQGGGAGGHAAVPTMSSGGAGGSVTAVALNLSHIKLTGDVGGNGGQGAMSTTPSYIGETGIHGAGGNGGAGGGSVFGGLSQGGGAGLSKESSDGGAGGDISNIRLALNDVALFGANGGAGGQAATAMTRNTPDTAPYGAAGSGGAGGGSIFGGLSQGGGGGNIYAGLGNTKTANGGAGGAISFITLNLSNVELNGRQGGAGGQAAFSDSIAPLNSAYGAGGSGGAGGGSIFGGFSQGGGGGDTYTFGGPGGAQGYADGGAGGEVSNITLNLLNVKLIGQSGGDGGNAGRSIGSSANYGVGAGGAGGAGGGSIFAGFSQGGSSGTGAGGAGGDVHSNTLSLTDIELIGAAGGAGGAGGSGTTRSLGAVGAAGIDGGSIFGGYSAGGAGGFAITNDLAAADGGQGGNASDNTIELKGTSSLTGSLYGGYSQGGNAGQTQQGGDIHSPSSAITNSNAGLGGFAQNNRITLVGTDLDIGGSVYGGFSLDGDVDFATLGYSSLNNAKTFTGNTLTLDGYRGSVEGVYNFENYNWTLPADVVNRYVIIEIRGNDLVDLNNTKHSVAMLSDGNRLNENDEIVLISKAQGNQQTQRTQVQQGHFIIYDALLGINAADEFVLTIAGKDDTTPATPIDPLDNTPSAGRLNPTSKALLQGRAAALAMVNHGADMLSDQLTECATDVFVIGDGGSSRYNTGSSVKVSDQRLAIGGRKCFELPDNSQLMLGLFAEHGSGDYHSRNSFTDVGKVRGHGDLRYTGGGLVAHIDYAGTGTGVAAVPVLGSKDGLYNDAVLRAGNVKTDFASNQLIDASGKRAEYKSKSHYASALLGAGYVWNLDPHEQVDLYARYNWDRLASDKVKVGGDELRFGTDHSSRLRVGTRYNYAVTPAIAPYAGIAYEHEFDGKASGKVFEFDIDQPELKGSSGVLEVGVTTLPFGNDSHWHLDAGVQGYFGTRKGATGSLSVKYEF